MSIIKESEIKPQIIFKNALFLTHDAMLIANMYDLDGYAIVEEMMEANSKDDMLEVFDKYFGQYYDLLDRTVGDK